MKYTVYYETSFGSVSAESSSLEDLVHFYPQLERLASRIQHLANKQKKAQFGPVREGKGETSTILTELESRVLRTSFFSQPKTTRETQLKLEQLTKRRFTSRKVSQALGILREKGRLRRTGKRNFFMYVAK